MGRFQGLTTIIRLGRKGLPRANTVTLINYVRKIIYNIGPSGLYYKQVMIVIYDCNDIGLYYKTRDNRN